MKFRKTLPLALIFIILCWNDCILARRRKMKSRKHEGRIRLVGGRTKNVGTVLINHNGYWGAICDQWWGINDANVACKQLGYNGAVRPTRRSIHGHGRKRMWLTKMRCSGREGRLVDCLSPGWDRHTRQKCPGRFRSAGVVCVTSVPTTTTKATTASTTTTTTVTTTTTSTPATTTSSTTMMTTTLGLSELELEIAAWAAKRNESEEQARDRPLKDNEQPSPLEDIPQEMQNTTVANEADSTNFLNVTNASMRGNSSNTLDDIPDKNTTSEALKEKLQPMSKEGKDEKEHSELLADAPPDSPDFEIRIKGGRYGWEGHLEVREKDGDWGVICGDHWTLRETLVACGQIGEFGMGKQALTYSYFGGSNMRKLFYRVKCVGKEARLSDCELTRTSEDNKCSKATAVAGIVCSEHLPDLEPNIRALQDSVRLQDRPLFYLRCSMEENCLSHSAYVLKNTSRSWRNQYRRLLRFSTVVHNIGLADFRPYLARNQWEWHACHMHYHSMEVFAHYDIMDASGLRLAEGSKASFCLEDTVCDRGVKPKYNCRGFSDQGLSVNCSDNYMYDIDCQWIDITDIKPGDYTFLMEINPDLLVAESNFENNVISCHLNYNGYFAFLRNCHYQNLLDYRRPLKIPSTEG